MRLDVVQLSREGKPTADAEIVGGMSKVAEDFDVGVAVELAVEFAREGLVEGGDAGIAGDDEDVFGRLVEGGEGGRGGVRRGRRARAEDIPSTGRTAADDDDARADVCGTDLGRGGLDRAQPDRLERHLRVVRGSEDDGGRVAVHARRGGRGGRAWRRSGCESRRSTKGRRRHGRRAEGAWYGAHPLVADATPIVRSEGAESHAEPKR